MPLNSWLRNKLGGGRYHYTPSSKSKKEGRLFDREEGSTTLVRNKIIGSPIKMSQPRAKSISSGREGMIMKAQPDNQIPMNMLKKKSRLIISSRRG